MNLSLYNEMKITAMRKELEMNLMASVAKNNNDAKAFAEYNRMAMEAHDIANYCKQKGDKWANHN